MFGAQVGPEDAVSNLSKWIKWLPESREIDTWAMAIGVVLVITTVVLFFVKRREANLKEPIAPIIWDGREAATKRSFSVSEQTQFVGMIKERLPEAGTARVHYVALEFQPFAETIEALFKAAGWKSRVGARQVSKIPLVNVQGIGIAAYNKHYLEAVHEVFRECGVTDIYT